MPGKKVALTTDWVTIGKAGKTADGREIKEAWLIEAAATYDPEMYTAVINAEHIYGNFGTVTELRTGKAKDGATTLEARFQPNKYMLAQNSEKYRLFTSMEINPKFADTGKAYLTGLALTDSPASLGTTEIHFCQQDITAERADCIELPAELFTVKEPDADPDKTFLSKLKEIFNNKKDENEMNDAQFKQLTDGITATTAAVAKLVEAVGKFTAVPGKTEAEKNEKSQTETEKTGVTDEQFNKLLESQKAMQESIAGMSEKLTAAMKGTGKEIPAGTGGNDTPDFI